MDLISLGLSKKYTEDTAIGLGAVKGAPATIEKIVAVEGGNNVTFLWTGTDGTQQRQTLFVANGQKGETGPAGPRGQKGEKGDPGKPGKDGTDGAAIIDVLELPTENINKNAFYRLRTAKFVADQWSSEKWICHCVNNLPEIGEVCTDATLSFVIAYYNIADNNAYGYVDAELGAFLGAPAGWYPASVLLEFSGNTFGGIITDINDDPSDGVARVLLGYDFYTYQDEWTKIIFGYEKAPAFDIQWDGDMTDKFTVDMSALGFTGISITKISDQPLTTTQLIGSSYYYGGSDSLYEQVITEDIINTTAYSGGITVNNGEIVSIYSEDDANTALGLPSGYLTNGLYFFYNTDNEKWARRLVAPARITKIDGKYLPEGGVGKSVAGQVFAIDGDSITAGDGAEIFNNYLDNIASGEYSHAEGNLTEASEYCSHAEGSVTTASGSASHAEGSITTASGKYSHAEGFNTAASGEASHAEGFITTASGEYSHAEGLHTEANGLGQHVQGKFNIVYTDNVYAHIVGNGSSDTARSNAHTLDWDGNAWYAGTVETPKGLILHSPNGTRFTITVSDEGVLSATKI